MSYLASAVTALEAARPDLIEAEDYYNGTAAEIFASARIQRALANGSQHFRVNYCRIAVRSRLTRLEINSITGADQAQTDALNQVWDGNLLGMEAHDIHEAALEYGDAYAIVWPNADTDETEIFYNSPKSVRLFYSAENPRVKSHAVKMWVEGGKVRVDLYFADRIEPYVTVTEAGGRLNPEDFVPYVEEEGGDWPLLNPFGVVPVFHFRTARPYGRPEHKDAYGPQNMINKLVVTQMSAVDFQGFPQRFALEDPALKDESNSDADWQDEDWTDGETRPTENTSHSLKAGPGEVWWLKGVKAVGQFEAANPANFLEPMREYVGAMATVTDTPLHAFKLDGQMPSGESRRASEAPLNKRVQDLQLLFGATWKELFRFVLRLQGFDKPQVALEWREPESYDSIDSWNAAKVQHEIGIPLEQIMRERGYTQPQIDEALAAVQAAPPVV